jgi:hypothetical protein
VIAPIGAQPSADELAAIVAALVSIETGVEAPAAAADSPWKLAGRDYGRQDDRCLARF